MAKVRYEVSLIEQEAVEAMEVLGKRGLCMHKFKADHITGVGITLGDLQVGDRITCDGKCIEIQKVGKQCFDGCVLVSEAAFCPLKKGCAFGCYVGEY